jgi:hypothetical protein
VSNRSAAGYWAAVLALAVVAVAIRHESIRTGFFADDYAQLGMLAGKYPVARSKLDLFTFSDGSITEGETLIRSGFYPWFSDPTLRLSMLRPLASAMIALDYAIFGRNPLGYHIHSILWWCFLFGVTAELFRRVLPAAQAVLALALFAVDETHCVIVTWIANRSAVVSVTFAVVGLILYLRSSKRTDSTSAWLIALCYLIAFGFGEYALCVIGYVIAYELIAADGDLRTRTKRLWPIAIPSIAYLAFRSAFAYTPQSSGMYVDPLSDPAGFGAAVIRRLPVMAADALFGLRGEYWTFGVDPWFYRWLDPHWLAPNAWDRLADWQRAQLVLGGIACLLLWVICRFVWRRDSNPSLRWLSVGGALSLFPVLGSFPSSRLLLVPLLGFCPLLASLFFTGIERAQVFARSGRRVTSFALGAAVTIPCLFHTAFATWLTRDWTLGMATGSQTTLKAVLNLEADEHLAEQHVVMLAAPEGSTSMYVPLTRWVYGRSVPLSCFTLSLVPSAYLLTRVADDAFTIEYDAPAAVLRTASEQLLHGAGHPLHVNDVVDAGLFSVTIQALRESHPSRLLIHFVSPLEHRALRFMTVTRTGIRQFPLPAVGGTVVVPEPMLPDE